MTTTSLEFDGLKVLVDPLSAQYVEGAQVDWVDGLMGRGFTVVNPTYQAENGGGGGSAAAAAPAGTKRSFVRRPPSGVTALRARRQRARARSCRASFVATALTEDGRRQTADLTRER